MSSAWPAPLWLHGRDVLLHEAQLCTTGSDGVPGVARVGGTFIYRLHRGIWVYSGW